MQVFGLPGQIIKNGRAASCLLAARTPDIEAARRRDAVARLAASARRRPQRRACGAAETLGDPVSVAGKFTSLINRWLACVEAVRHCRVHTK
jgi:hypothetical protein